jgi:hypothetical protein
MKRFLTIKTYSEIHRSLIVAKFCSAKIYHNTKKPKLGNCPTSVFVHPNAKLLGFAVGYVLAHGGVIAAQFEPAGVVLAVLDGGIGVGTLGAPQLDDDAVAFFAGHGVPHKTVYNLPHCTKLTPTWQTVDITSHGRIAANEFASMIRPYLLAADVTSDFPRANSSESIR